MIFDVVEGNPQFWIRYENLIEEVTHVLADKFVVLGLAESDFLVNSLGRLGLEWRLSGSDLDHEDAERPDVDLIPVAIVSSKDFRSDVSGRSAIRLGPLLDTIELLRKAEVN